MTNRHISRDDDGTRDVVSRKPPSSLRLGPDHPKDFRAPIHILFWKLPDYDELRVARPVAVVLLATVPRSNSRAGN